MSDKARNLRLKTVFLFLVTCTPGTAVCARDALDIFLAPVHTRTDLLYCACGSVRFRVPVLVGFSRSSRVCLWLPVACGLLGIPHHWVTHSRDPCLHPDPVVTPHHGVANAPRPRAYGPRASTDTREGSHSRGGTSRRPLRASGGHAL